MDHKNKYMDAVNFNSVTFAYEDGTEVLKDMSLDIATGSYTVILGHNGSGKSTLARHINALLIPDSGTVEVFGLNTDQEDNWISIRRNAGMVFQYPEDQMVTSVVKDDIAFGPENLGIPRQEIIKRVDEAIIAVDMQDFADVDPQDLSGGQKQRIAIAGILAMKPKLIIFDEAGAMLDPQGRKDLAHRMKTLHNQGYTIIHITHFIEDALQADRVLVLDNGTIVFDGSPEEVLIHTEELQALGLDAPFTINLISALRTRGIELERSLYTDELLNSLEEALS